MHQRFLRASAIFALIATSSIARAGYDFEPISLRFVGRYWGVGPGPGYHSVPCNPLVAPRQYRLSHGYADYMIEPDYRPSLFSEGTLWHEAAPGPFHTKTSFGGLPPQPAAVSSPLPKEAARGTRSDPRPTQPEAIPRGDRRTPPTSIPMSPRSTRDPILDELLWDSEPNRSPRSDPRSPTSPSDHRGARVPTPAPAREAARWW